MLLAVDTRARYVPVGMESPLGHACNATQVRSPTTICYYLPTILLLILALADAYQLPGALLVPTPMPHWSSASIAQYHVQFVWIRPTVANAPITTTCWGLPAWLTAHSCTTPLLSIRHVCHACTPACHVSMLINASHARVATPCILILVWLYAHPDISPY